MEVGRRVFLAGAAAPLSRLFGREPDSLPEAPFRSEKGWTPLLNGRDLAFWRVELGWRGVAGRTNEWFTTASVSWPGTQPPDRLVAQPEPGGIIVNGIETHTTNLVTERKFGDIDLYLEFMFAKGSNSGVYLHGLYEVQVFDSYGATRPPTYSDGGGIYQRWESGKGFGGFAPRSNASRPPGQWQFYRIRFRAPRFAAAGGKTENAKFDQVIYNGVTVHENVVCDGPTRSALEIPEAAANPLMLQGDHGPVAYRNICFRPLPNRR